MTEVNTHIPVMLNEIKKFIPDEKKINIIDATFGGGSYSKEFLENFEVENLIAIDRDPITNIFAQSLKKRFSNFSLVNDCFSNIDNIYRCFLLVGLKESIIMEHFPHFKIRPT